MKRENAEIGIRYWGNEDLIALQAEPLKALEGFFAAYGPCVVQGCEVVGADGAFDVSKGLVVLQGKDHADKDATMIVPFEGVSGVSLPLYLTLACSVEERVYGDGKVKPVAYGYYAKPSTTAPAESVPYLAITTSGAPRFVDVMQDAAHRFITDTQKAQWNAKETLAGAQAKADAASAAAKSHADAGDASTLTAAKTYTHGRETAVRTDMVAADTVTLRDAKSYADAAVAALVDGSPEALNTLQELAAALGDDPNFATTVMTLIGEKLPSTTFEAFKSKAWTTENFAPATKADVLYFGDLGTNNRITTAQFINLLRTKGVINAVTGKCNWNYAGHVIITDTGVDEIYTAGATISCYEGGGSLDIVIINDTGMYVYSGRGGNLSDVSKWRKLYHSGNFNPDGKFNNMNGASDSDNIVGNGYTFMETGSSFSGPFLKWGKKDWMVEFFTGNNINDIRIRNMTNGVWGNSVKMWHSGNFNASAAYVGNRRSLTTEEAKLLGENDTGGYTNIDTPGWQGALLHFFTGGSLSAIQFKTNGGGDPNLYYRTQGDGSPTGWTEWMRLFHSSNFDPGGYFNCRNGVNAINIDNILPAGVYPLTPAHITGTTVPQGVANCNLLVYNSDHFMGQRIEECEGSKRTWERRWYCGGGQTGAGIPFQLIPSGSLATSTTPGLMSAADKAKLDGVITSKCYGRITKDGGYANTVGVSRVSRTGAGKYTVYHPYGHNRVVVTATVSATEGDGNMFDNSPIVVGVYSDCFVIYMGTNPGSVEDCGFNFITMSY